jgi:hypothetical protein
VTACRVITALALASALDASAQTLSLLGGKLPNTAGDPYLYWIDGRSRTPVMPPLPSPDVVEGIIQTCFATWQAVPCQFLTFTDKGQVQEGPNSSDGYNTMGSFEQSETQDNDAYDYALGGGVALAVALPLMYDGVIYDCDVVFNAVDYQWSTPGAVVPDGFDVGTVALQEVAHCMGLGHYTGDPNSVMYPTFVPGQIKTKLAPNDIYNICYLYPRTGGVGSACDAGQCAAGDGGAPLTCVTDPTTGDPFCTTSCDPASGSGCPVGFYCAASTNPSPGCCYPGSAPSVAGVGAPCSGNSDCGPSGICFPATGSRPYPGGYCSQQCLGPGAVPCPAQSSCYDDVCNGNDCFCLEDCNPVYADCRQGYTCEAVSAGLGRCRPACASDADCVSGSTCRTCDGVCMIAGNASAHVGDACAQDSDCAQGQICLAGPDGFSGGYCSATCYTACTRPCPDNASCLPYGTQGDLICLKSCVTASDCRQGYRCGAVGAGQGCVAGCMVDNDCPVGDQCVNGQCGFDAGIPAGSDAGGRDGGAVPRSASCGCAANDSREPVAALIILLAICFFRRRPALA